MSIIIAPLSAKADKTFITALNLGSTTSYTTCLETARSETLNPTSTHKSKQTNV